MGQRSSYGLMFMVRWRNSLRNVFVTQIGPSIVWCCVPGKFCGIMPLWFPILRYCNSVIESIIIWNSARVDNMGSSLELMMWRIHKLVKFSKLTLFDIFSEGSSRWVAMPCGRHRYAMVSLHAVTILWTTSYVTRVPVRLRYVILGHWFVSAIMSLFRTLSVAKLILLIFSVRYVHTYVVDCLHRSAPTNMMVCQK